MCSAIHVRVYPSVAPCDPTVGEIMQVQVATGLMVHIEVTSRISVGYGLLEHSTRYIRYISFCTSLGRDSWADASQPPVEPNASRSSKVYTVDAQSRSDWSTNACVKRCSSDMYIYVQLLRGLASD